MSSVLKDAGFPMSSVLRGVGASIGRKGRMLACQTANKFTETTSGQTLDRTYWRALLQVSLEHMHAATACELRYVCMNRHCYLSHSPRPSVAVTGRK